MSFFRKFTLLNITSHTVYVFNRVDVRLDGKLGKCTTTVRLQKTLPQILWTHVVSKKNRPTSDSDLKQASLYLIKLNRAWLITRLPIVRREQPCKEGVPLLLGELRGCGGVWEHGYVEGLQDGGHLFGHAAVRSSHHACNESLLGGCLHTLIV